MFAPQSYLWNDPHVKRTPTRLARQSKLDRRWQETETRRNEDNSARCRVPGRKPLPRHQTVMTKQMPNTPNRRRPRDKSTLTASKTVRPTQAIATRNASKTHHQLCHVFRAEKRGSVILTELNRREAEAMLRQRNGQIQVTTVRVQLTVAHCHKTLPVLCKPYFGTH